VLAAFGAGEVSAARAKAAANWVMVDLAAALNRDGLEATASPVRPGQLAVLIRRIEDGTISGKIARELFGLLWAEPHADDAAPDQLIDARGLRQISDSGALVAIIDDIIKANPRSVEEFRAGKDKAFNALVGQVMKASRGKANPQQVNALLRERLGAAS
jgi:aspartyl-tRNA(Asn)/glutamyl-tRNA(Gln) amidotransferase subunit B